MSDQELSAYRVKVSVRNNLLLSAIEQAGYKTSAEFAREIGVNPSQVVELTSLRVAPLNKDGEFSNTAKKIMEVLGAAPTDLWTPEQLTMKLKSNVSERGVSSQAIKAILGGNVLQIDTAVEGVDYEAQEDPGVETEKKEFSFAMKNIIDSLTPREAKVLRMRFGIDMDPMSLEEVAAVFDVTKQRVRQIEERALRKMRGAKRLLEIAKTGYEPQFNDGYFDMLLKSSWLRHKKLTPDEDEENDEPETDS